MISLEYNFNQYNFYKFQSALIGYDMNSYLIIIFLLFNILFLEKFLMFGFCDMRTSVMISDVSMEMNMVA